MQFKEANRLRDEWGSKPCNHPGIEKEYYWGAQTGDYVCTTCGKAFSSHQEWESSRSDKPQSA
jgi:hypothetical protein